MSKFKVGDKVKIKKGSLKGNAYTVSSIESCGYIHLQDLPYLFFDYELEPVDSKTLRMADGTIYLRQLKKRQNTRMNIFRTRITSVRNILFAKRQSADLPKPSVRARLNRL